MSPVGRAIGPATQRKTLPKGAKSLPGQKKKGPGWFGTGDACSTKSLTEIFSVSVAEMTAAEPVEFGVRDVVQRDGAAQGLGQLCQPDAGVDLIE